MNMQTNKWVVYLVITTFIACVPARQVEELKAKQQKCEEERNGLTTQNQKLETRNNELQESLDDISKRISALQNDTTVLGNSLRKMTLQYDKINKLNDELLKKQTQLKEGNEAENKKLLIELQATQEELQQKGDALKEIERELNLKKENLENLGSQLEKREQRVNELESMIAQKDKAVNELKDKITKALLGFQDKGLTIEQKNGKIYVSLEAELLFAKGSTIVDQKGKGALINLAKSLEGNEDIHILVEGHTDTDKISGGKFQDNWDLSVMRATAVVRILTDNSKIAPKQITAAGRGEYVPVDNGKTEEAKSKNRRIEIILTPNLDALFEIIEAK